MDNHDERRDRMPVRAALQALAAVRDERTIVVTHQGAARVWPLIAEHPLDFHHNPSTMGGGTPLALGLALSNPSLEVIVVTGDGSLAMSLGSLVTVIASDAANLTVVVLDNGIYEVTGGQQTAAGAVDVDYAGLARSVGFQSAFEFDNPFQWGEEAGDVIRSPGPRFVSLRVETVLPDDLGTPAPPMASQVARLSRELSERA